MSRVSIPRIDKMTSRQIEIYSEIENDPRSQVRGPVAV